MRMKLAVIACLVFGYGAFAGELDLIPLRDRLAAQEARIADLQAKLGTGYASEGAPEGIVSMRKNAVVTIGGVVSTKYTYHRSKIDSSVDMNEQPKPYGRTGEARYGDLEIGDADLAVQIDVNEHFDAYLEIDLQNSGNDDYEHAKAYWIRWKDICNTGFGLKVGRDALVFGEEGVGELGSYAAGSGDGIGEAFDLGESLIMPHNGWDMDGVVQVTPYWEGLDGKLSVELSFMQNTFNDGPHLSRQTYTRVGTSGVVYEKSRNYGIGSMSGRVVYSPFEDLRLSASVVNFHSNGSDDLPDFMHNKNNTAMSLAFNYNPCFLNKLNIWSQWIRGWNVDNMDGYRSDALNFGVSYDLTDKFTVFAQGDYLWGRVSFTDLDYRYRGKAKSAYVGGVYEIADGLTLEGGWKREWVDYTENGAHSLRAKADTAYLILGFEF